MFKLNISYEFKQNVFLLFAAILSIFISFFISFEVVSLRNDWDVVIFIICCPVIWFVLVMFWFAFFPDKESERILLEEIKAIIKESIDQDETGYLHEVLELIDEYLLEDNKDEL